MDVMLQPQLPVKEGKIMKCKICGKKVVRRYCQQHGKAFSNIVEKYNVWKMALEISCKEYLNEIVNNKYSGSWIKEVAEKLLSEKVDSYFLRCL